MFHFTYFKQNYFFIYIDVKNLSLLCSINHATKMSGFLIILIVSEFMNWQPRAITNNFISKKVMHGQI